MQNKVKVNKLQQGIFGFCRSENNMIRIDPGAIIFSRGFSLERKHTVGKQITVEQLIELSIVIRISRYDHVYRHHVRDK